MNENISLFLICVEAIIYFLSYNIHDCTIKTAFKIRENNCFTILT